MMSFNELKTMRLALAIFTTGLILPNTVLAVDDELYYQLGGGEPIGRATTNRGSTFKLGIDAAYSSNLTCGNFDISLSVKQQLNGVTGAFQDLMGDVVNSATGAVASLPALVIQKVNPALYDLLQNGVLQASGEFGTAAASCEDMVEKMRSSTTGTGWETISQSGFWVEKSQSSSSEILSVKKSADTEGLNHGVTWVDGEQKGGAAQPPIEVIGDTVKAGYNQLINRSPGNTQAATSSCAGAAICEIWDSPQHQATWVVDVLGEVEIRTCEGCTKLTSKSGVGLATKIQEEQEQIQTDMTALVASNSPPSGNQLKTVSGGPNLRVTRRIIEAIRDERPQTRGALIRRLSSEMALNRTMERALMARRSLLAGMKEPNIANADIAQKRLATAVAELNQEMDNVLFEMDVRSRIAGNTAATLIHRNLIRNRVPVSENQQPRTVIGGAVENP